VSLAFVTFNPTHSHNNGLVWYDIAWHGMAVGTGLFKVMYSTKDADEAADREQAATPQELVQALTGTDTAATQAEGEGAAGDGENKVEVDGAPKGSKWGKHQGRWSNIKLPERTPLLLSQFANLSINGT
jgi:hypothetical protein